MNNIRAFFAKKRIDAAKLLISTLFIVLVVIPLVRMFINIDADSISKVFNSPSFLPALTNSLTTALTATAISVTMAFLLALCMQRTSIKCKGILSGILILPMLIPSISHGMGLIVLLGANGVITNFLQLNSSIYGFGGIVLGSVLYSFPVAFLMLNDVMKFEDSSPYEAAAVLGIPKSRRISAITLPYLKKPLISTVFATFTLVVTDYGIPLMIGGKCNTLSVLMYNEVIGQLNFGMGSVIGVLLLIPAVVAFLFDLINKDKGKSGYVTRKFEIKKRPVADTLSYVFCGVVCLFALSIVVAFCIIAFTTRYPSNLAFTFANITKTLNLRGGRYLLNSVIIAAIVSVVGVVIAFITAYMTSRLQSKLTRFLHLISITSLAIPGIVLGLSYVLTFKSSFVYGTIAILVMVNLMHFFASPYLMMYNSLNKLNANIESVGSTLGISRTRVIMHVIIPQCRSTLAEMLSYFFVNSMMTISAVSFLATTSTKPVALMINQFEAQMQLESAAVVSLAILLVNIIIKAIVYLIKRFARTDTVPSAVKE